MPQISHFGRQTDGSPNPIDIHVGARIRLRRTLLGLSQQKLADAVRLSFQQIQKYEKGANRISASRLYDFARILDVPVSFFFDDLDPAAIAASPAAQQGDRVAILTAAPPAIGRDVMDLIRAYDALPAPARPVLRLLLRSLTADAAAQAAE